MQLKDILQDIIVPVCICLIVLNNKLKAFVKLLQRYESGFGSLFISLNYFGFHVQKNDDVVLAAAKSSKRASRQCSLTTKTATSNKGQPMFKEGFIFIGKLNERGCSRE